MSCAGRQAEQGQVRRRRLSHFSVSSERSLRQPPVAVLVSNPTETADRSWKNSREAVVARVAGDQIGLPQGDRLVGRRGIVNNLIQPERLRDRRRVGLGLHRPAGRRSRSGL